MERAMKKQWRPHVDLARLSAACAEEILAASEQEMEELSARSGYSLTGAAQEVRNLIHAASDEQRDRLPAMSARLSAIARQH
jgi:hypothetical protein